MMHHVELCNTTPFIDPRSMPYFGEAGGSSITIKDFTLNF